MLVLLISMYAGAQELCGTPSPRIIREPILQRNSLVTAQESVCINVFFHIVRDNNGAGGINPNQLQNIMNKLSDYYTPFNIHFVNLGYDYINNSNYQQIDSNTEASTLSGVNNFSNMINYYIVDSLWNVGGGYVTGTAVSIPSNRLVIRKDNVLSTTSSHEVGHCLNLLHTHETAYGTEAINGSNCSTAGDQVCDTPADNMTGATSGYNPDQTNLMSYYSVRNHFTPGQNLRMKTAMTNSTLLSKLINTSCSAPALAGPSNICSTTEATFTLTGWNGIVSWAVSPNLQILSSTTTSITVKANNNFINEDAYVHAVLPYKTITQNFYIGMPYTAMNLYCPNYFDSYCDLNSGGAYFGAGQTISLSIVGKGTTGNGIGSADWEWQKVSGDFKFVTYGPLGNGVPQNNGDKSIGSFANIQINSLSSSISFQTKARNSCGWGYSKFYYYSSYLRQSYSIYPNPVTETLIVEKDGSESNEYVTNSAKSNIPSGYFELYDFNSVLVAKGSLDNTTKIDVSKFKQGIYILNLVAGGETTTHKIVIN